MVWLIKGRGDKRQVVQKADGGKTLHEQRRFIKQQLGLLR